MTTMRNDTNALALSLMIVGIVLLFWSRSVGPEVDFSQFQGTFDEWLAREERPYQKQVGTPPMPVGIPMGMKDAVEKAGRGKEPFSLIGIFKNPPKNLKGILPGPETLVFTFGGKEPDCRMALILTRKNPEVILADLEEFYVEESRLLLQTGGIFLMFLAVVIFFAMRLFIIWIPLHSELDSPGAQTNNV